MFISELVTVLLLVEAPLGYQPFVDITKHGHSQLVSHIKIYLK